ncbi:hypothetical protein EYC80_010011 [Monilinia laxa]|uniref:Uncharacterized protein n=1 Tax=Monilinia laxa TaxID=61186 RepID=A0A5N6JS06_MONLA|nr:hypothetical protein EYC80_010011 [Monilinia laxa]
MPPINPNMPLLDLSTWSPFRIDALGLVTLIGAEEVSKSIGRLVTSRYTKFLPVLGAYLIAGNQFMTSFPGYTIYNVSDSITTTCVSGWLTRWLNAQDLNSMSLSVFEWTCFQERRNRPWQNVSAGVIGLITMGGLFVIAILSSDGFGIANATAMAFSVLVRWYLVRENMEGLDQAVFKVCRGPSTHYFDERVKLLITLANGKLVTFYAPRGLVVAGFTKKPIPPHDRLYRFMRGVGWLNFGIHIIALGQSYLVSQIYTVVLLVLSTWATIQGLGCDEEEVANRLTAIATKVDTSPSPPDRRLCAYVALEPTDSEEESLAEWGLLPRKANTKWWLEYREAKAKWSEERRKIYAISSQSQD